MGPASLFPSLMATLFSYVVDHDTGFAPNPCGEFCTLVHCKHQARTGRRNVVELAQPGDWIIGTGGQSKRSCGNGRVVYVMRVDEKIPFRDYLRDGRFHGRADQVDLGNGNQYALIAKTFFYFGRNAIPVSDIPTADLGHPIEKKGPGFRRDFPESFVRQFVTWVQRKYDVGMHGEPCASASKEGTAKCGARRGASRCCDAGALAAAGTAALVGQRPFQTKEPGPRFGRGGRFAR